MNKQSNLSIINKHTPTQTNKQTYSYVHTPMPVHHAYPGPIYVCCVTLLLGSSTESGVAEIGSLICYGTYDYDGSNYDYNW